MVLHRLNVAHSSLSVGRRCDDRETEARFPLKSSATYSRQPAGMPSLKVDSKWGVNNMGKVLALALVLVVSVHILAWNGRRGLVQLPCPTDLTSAPSSDSDDLPPLPTQREAASSSSSQPPNSFFPDSDSDIWHCKEHEVEVSSYADWVRGPYTDEQRMCAAHRQSKRPMAPGTPRIAFLFMTRDGVALEPVWRKFFAGHEARFSIYVHVHDSEYRFPEDSIFHGRTVPSQPIDRFAISLPEAARRLFAIALLDAAVPNAWFHLQCDASIPIRGFDYVYDYITNSSQSFVEAFYPTAHWWRANWKDNSTVVIPDRFMRKGEFWVTLHRRHAGVVVGDPYVFPRFKHNWFQTGLSGEVYIPTLMALVDPAGIALHSLVHVNWLNHTEGTSSPVTLNATTVTAAAIRAIQNLTTNAFGFYHVDKRWDDDSEKSCVYNGVPESPCFLFTRKVERDASVAASVLKLAPVLGY